MNLCVPDPVEEIWETSKGKLPLRWPNFIVSFWHQRAESPSRHPSPATLMNKLSIAACTTNQCHGWKSTDHCAFCVDCCVVRLETFKFSKKSIDPPCVWSKITTDFGRMKLQFQSSLHWGSQSRLPAIFQQSPSNTELHNSPSYNDSSSVIYVTHPCHTTAAQPRRVAAAS